jgi:hypothetical protein
MTASGFFILLDRNDSSMQATRDAVKIVFYRWMGFRVRIVAQSKNAARITEGSCTR